MLPGRSPCGERGLKLHLLDESTHLGRSLPVRGAWVEITADRTPRPGASSLPVRGAWVEILMRTMFMFGRHCRSPCGERGLK